MPRGFSLWLDLLRVAAALTVFASHLSQPEFAGRGWGVPNHVGHSAVVVFFVLSGYVIAWTTAECEGDWRRYAAARAARLYSVVVPALLITMLIDWSLLGTDLSRAVPLYQLAHAPKYLVLFLGFGTDAWFLRETAFSNPTYWSLTYEVAYYAAFGAIVFLPGWWRFAGVLVVAAVYGPRPLLLAPLWIAGAWLARRNLRGGPVFNPAVSRWLGLASLWCGLILIGVQARAADVPVTTWLSGGVEPARALWRYSRFAPGDLLLGALVTLNLASAYRMPFAFTPAIDRAIRAAANRTFTLYLLHYQLLEFWSAHLHPHPVVLIALVLGCAWIIGGLIEPRRTWLRRLFARALAALA